MKKFTLFLTLFFAATMTIFAQDGALTVTASQYWNDAIGDGGAYITFSKAVTYTEPADGLEILDEKGDVAGEVSSLAWNGDMTRAFVLLDNPIDAAGTYFLTIPAGAIATADGEELPETTLTFIVEKPVVNPEWWTDYDYASTVNEFQKITISFSNVTSLKLNGETPFLFTAAGNDEEGEVEIVEIEDKDGKKQTKIEITFSSKYTEEGNYEVYIPEGMFTMNESVNNSEKWLKFAIVKPAEVTPLEIVSITPKINANGEFEEIEIVYNQTVRIGDENWSYYAVYLTDSNGNQYSMWPKDPYDYNGYLVIPGNTVVLMPVKLSEYGYPYEMNEYWQYIASPFAMEGEYTLNLADMTLRYGYDVAIYDYNAFGSIEGTYTFDKNTTAIENVEAEAEGTVIYDLTGRRVNEITKAGIYIVNGVKKVIK